MWLHPHPKGQAAGVGRGLDLWTALPWRQQGGPGLVGLAQSGPGSCRKLPSEALPHLPRHLSLLINTGLERAGSRSQRALCQMCWP